MALALEKRRILVVEDEYFQADELRHALERAGANVLGPNSNLEHALAVATAGVPIDAAVLDVNVAGRPVLPVADALAARNIPFLFLTGDERWTAPDRFGRTLMCRKPIALALLIEQVKRLSTSCGAFRGRADGPDGC